jgi:hypothetical protein
MIEINKCKMSIKTVRRSIYAMERLIYLYAFPEYYRSCPLCGITGSCVLCPWEVLLKRGCGDNRFNVIRRYPEKVEARIKQLRRWVRIYKKAAKGKL